MFVSVFASLVSLWAGGIHQGWVESESSRIGCENGEDVGRYAGDWITVCTYLAEDGWRLRSISNEHVNWFVFASPSGRTSDRIMGEISPAGAGDSCEIFNFSLSLPQYWYFSGGEVRATIHTTSTYDCARQVELWTYQVIALDPDQPEVACLIGDLDAQLLDRPLVKAQQIAEEFAVGWSCEADDPILFGNEQSSDFDSIVEARRAAR